MTVWTYSIVSVLVISALSAAGLLTLAVNQQLLHRALLYLVSFAAGALLGDVFFHILPEATEAKGFSFGLSMSLLLGILFSFVLEKIIRWRHSHKLEFGQTHPVAFVNLTADGIHNFVDGVIVAASFAADLRVGLATVVAVVFHEIPQEIGDFGVLIHAGFSRAKALLFNGLTALTALAGAVAALVMGTLAEQVAELLLPFAAGNFLYIACSDLLPELHEHASASSSWLQLLLLILGISAMALLLLFG